MGLQRRGQAREEVWTGREAPRSRWWWFGFNGSKNKDSQLSSLSLFPIPLPSFSGSIGPERTQDSCPSVSACPSARWSLCFTHTHTHKLPWDA